MAISNALEVWITANGGVAKTATMLGLSPDALWAWLRRERRPSSDNIVKLIAASKGQLTFENILASVAPKKGGRK